MVGRDCVAIACDLRLGMQALTVSNNFPKIFQYGDHVFLGLTGLATDVTTVSDLFRYKVNMYRLREERNIAPTTFANLVSSSLYEKPSDADVEKREAPLVDEHDASRPAWQRIVAGDAKEGYDTQRALNTRHIMMIGASPGIAYVEPYQQRI